MSETVLTGLDGSNPLGFFAALGVLRALKESGQDRMRWVYQGSWHPALPLEREDLMTSCVEGLSLLGASPAMGLEYSRKKVERDLKPPPAVARQYLLDMRVEGGLAAELAAAFLSDVAVDNNGFAKPTALHFTAGQQRFLDMAGSVLQACTPEQLPAVLFDPWRRDSIAPRFEWDATLARLFAYRATDPSKDKKLSVPGANALALLGLSLLPSMPVGTRLRTTGVSGGWKSGAFGWCLWERSLSADSARALLSLPAKKRPAGVAVAFSSQISRTDQGGYGSFSPAQILL